MCAAALFTALSCVVTYAVKIPSPTEGYINPGDAVVLIGGFLLGPGLGALAGGLGSALADGLAGYMHYIPGTFIIKAAMGAAAGAIIRYGDRRGHGFAGAVLGALAAEIIMVAGYLVYAALVLGYGAGALLSIPGNIVQGAFGGVASVSLYLALSKIPYVRGWSDWR